MFYLLNTCRVYGSFAMESIFAAAFGRVIEIQKGESNSLTEAGVAFFKGSHEYKVTAHTFWRLIMSKREGREGRRGEDRRGEERDLFI